jgi:hypothetical protein
MSESNLFGTLALACLALAFLAVGWPLAFDDDDPATLDEENANASRHE